MFVSATPIGYNISNMKMSFFKTRFLIYLVFLTVFGAFLFNFLLAKQSAIMYKYFIEKPSAYNIERAERLSSSIYQSFKTEVTTPSLENIRAFVRKYNEIPFLSVNFIYKDETGTIKSILEDVNEIDILSAEYVFPIKRGPNEIGTLLVYDINKEYKRGLAEYAQTMNLTRIFFILLLFLLLSILLYREYSARVEQAKRIAEYQAVHDGLTSLYTHKFFKEHLLSEIKRSERYKRPVALIMCDVDFFKKFNDTYGHLVGDEILKTVSQILSENVRATDLVARYGGEEFAILLIEAGHRQAKETDTAVFEKLHAEVLDAAKRIKSKIQDMRIDVGENRSVGVTISMGISFYSGGPGYKPEYLISEADLALYESKNNGRNLITVFNPDTKEFIRYA